MPMLPNCTSILLSSIWLLTAVEGQNVLGNSNPNGVTTYPLSRRVLFAANDQTTGMEIWQLIQGGGPPILLKDINPLGGSHPHEIVLRVPSGDYLFAADDGSHGVELWRTDGTTPGTNLLAAIA